MLSLSHYPSLFHGVILGCLLMGAHQAIGLDPKGVMIIPLKGESDTIIGVPLVREKVYEGTVESITGNVITLAGSPAWETDEFVYTGAINETDTYYVIIASGPVDGNGQPTAASKEGSYYTIIANTSDTLTVELAGDDLSGVATNVSDGVGDLVYIHPYWTLDRLFPGGGGLHQSPSFSPVSSVFLPDLGKAGINLSPHEIYFYYSGSLAGGPGFRRQGASPVQLYDDLPIAPDTYLIVRHTLAEDTELVLNADVCMVAYQTPLNVIASGVDQDNAVYLGFATDTTLSESQLFESGAFQGSTTFAPVDSLLIFNNDAAGINKSPYRIYFYYLGSEFGGPGWRLQGDSPTTIHDDRVVFQLGAGYIIRKSALQGAGSAFWKVAPPYLSP